MDLKSKIDNHFSSFLATLKTVETDINNNLVSFEGWAQEVLCKFQEVKDNNRSIYFIGNGASASMADHFAADFNKNAFVSASSLTESALLTCFSNDYGYENAYAEILKRKISNGDIVVVISSSGNSKNLINAVKFANEFKDVAVITFTSFKSDNAIKKAGDYNLFVPSVEYSFAESAHAYYLHLLTDLFCNQTDSIQANNPNIEAKEGL